MTPGRLGPPVAPLRTGWRLLIAVVAAGYIAHWVYTVRSRPDIEATDFSQIWYAAGALLRGENPYLLIGPGRAYDWPSDFYYPLTAAVVAIPFAPLSLLWAQVAFSAVSAAALAWALTRFGVVGLLMLVSPSAVMALQYGQWSALFTVALLVPAMGVLFAAKPTIGAAIFAARPSWWPIVGGVVLAGAAFVLQPAWPLDWLQALRSTDVAGGGPVPYGAPLSRPGGIVLLAALLRWRRPEARLLVLLAAVPQTPLLYETLPLLFVAQTVGQVGWFFAAGWLALVAENLLAWQLGRRLLDANGIWIVAFFYLPALVLILRRPNAGPAPRWLERVVSRAPRWLRGQPESQPEAA